MGFSAFRDHNEEPRRKKKSRKSSNGALGAMEEDSDEDDDDEVPIKMEEEDEKDDEKADKSRLGPEDAQFSGELADGVKRIRVSPTPYPYVRLDH